MLKIHQLRKDYNSKSLSIDDLDQNPFIQFEEWLKLAINKKVLEPTAMTLSTATPNGIPSSRMVLLKEWNKKGGIFYTNSQSQKALEIKANPEVSCLFWWKELERQVIMTGHCSKVSKEKTFQYFSQRPLKSQIAAWVSMQGHPLKSKEILQNAYDELYNKWKDKAIPLPPHWIGYQIIPTSFQFWQGQRNRLHDHIIYLKTGKKWTKQLLYP